MSGLNALSEMRENGMRVNHLDIVTVGAQQLGNPSVRFFKASGR